jgi:hypothetical protein
MSMARVLGNALRAPVGLAMAAAAVGCGEVAIASTGAKGGSFPSIGVTDEPNDSTTVIKKHDGVRTVTRHAAEL